MQNILFYNKVSLLFLVGAMAYGVMTAGITAAVVTLVVSASVIYLIKAFHNKKGVRHTFMAGVMLTLAAMAWPYVLLFLPFLLFFLVKPLEAFSGRNVMAMLLGTLTPLWLYLPYWLYIHFQMMDWAGMPDSYMRIVKTVRYFNYEDVTALQIIIYGILLLFFLVLTVRRTPYCYKGKLFVRSQRAIYITLTWVSAAFLLVFPSFADCFLPLMAAFIGPVAAQVAIGDDR